MQCSVMNMFFNMGMFSKTMETYSKYEQRLKRLKVQIGEWFIVYSQGVTIANTV